MNNIQSLEHPTMNGLKSLTLDDLTTGSMTASNLNANYMDGDFFSIDTIEARDVQVDAELHLTNNGFIIVGKGTASEVIITDDEIKFLADIRSNIQDQVDLINNDTTNLVDDISLNTYNIGVNAINISNNVIDIAQNTTDINQNTTVINQNTTDINQNTTDINQNTTDINQNTTDINQNTIDISQNTTDISQNTTDISQNTYDYNIINTQVNTNVDDIDNINNDLLTVSNTSIANTNAITNIDSEILAIKIKTDVIETVAPNITYQRHNVGFRNLITGGNQGYIGTVGNGFYISADGSVPIIINPDLGYIHHYCENTYFGDNNGSGKIILQNLGANPGQLIINSEVQSNAYTNADHDNIASMLLRLNDIEATLLTIVSTPIGTVIAYSGTTVPPHYLLCNGQEISQTTYASLYTVIGLLYSHGRTTSPGAGNFFVPQLEAGFICGSGRDLTHTQKITNSTIKNVGDFNQMTVQGHSHMYDRSGSESAGSGVPTKTVGSNNYTAIATNGTVYDDGSQMGIGITQPNNVAMYFLIQYE